MCGRYYIEIEDWEMKDILKKVEERLHSETTDTKTGEVSPTDIAPALTTQGFAAMRWGFPRYDGKGIIINARSESVMEKPNLTAEWWDKYNRLDKSQIMMLHEIVAINLFDQNTTSGDTAVDEVLKYYQVRRDPQ